MTPDGLTGLFKMRAWGMSAGRKPASVKLPSDFRLALYRVKAPLAGDALELVLAAVFEGQPGAGDQILDGARDEHLAGLGIGSDLAPVCTAMPATFPSISSHSPVCRPTRTSSPSSGISSVMAQPQRMARAGPSKEAKKPSPAESTSLPILGRSRPK